MIWGHGKGDKMALRTLLMSSEKCLAPAAYMINVNMPFTPDIISYREEVNFYTDVQQTNIPKT